MAHRKEGVVTVELAQKVCPKCGERKPLSEFHRRSASPDGHQNYCKPCCITSTRESQSRRRAGMGEDAWLAFQRARVNASRQRTGNQAGRARSAARNAAIAKLIEAHRREFESLLRIEKYERGLL